MKFTFPYSFLLLLFCFLVSGSSSAQTYSIDDKKAIKSFQNAITAYDSRNYELALDLLQEAVDRAPEFVEAYLLRFEVNVERRNFEEAERALEEAVSISPDFFPNAWFFLGGIEMKRGAYDEAGAHFTKFLRYPGTNPEMREKAEKEIANSIFALKQLENPVPFDPQNMGAAVNSEMPEYYPTITADDQYLIFTRLVNDPQAFRGKNEDFFITGRKEGGGWENAIPLHGINSIFNEGAPTISGNGRILVFTGCELMGDYGPGRTGYGSCDLFVAERTGETWSEPQNLGKNINTSAWESQPSLSADGNTLYFVRGMPTRQGNREQDIYAAKRFTHGTWGKAERLPANINTPLREESVQIHPDGKTLYFSSEGHLGMGGLDIYRTEKIDDQNWKDPVNLGYPINTHGEENSLLVSADGTIAFFASDREGGYGDLDLYSFELPEKARPTSVTYAEGIVVDAETQAPVEAALKLSDVDADEVVFESSSDPLTGEFLVALPAGKTYSLSVKAPGYLYHSETFSLDEKPGNEPYRIRVELLKLEEGNTVVLKNVFFDLDKAELKARSKTELTELADFLRANPGLRIRIEGHTDDQGSAEYNKGLSERRAKAVKDYLTTKESIASDRIETKGYGAEKPIATNDTEEGRALNRRTEFAVIGTD